MGECCSESQRLMLSFGVEPWKRVVTPTGQRVGQYALDWWEWICTPYDRLSRRGIWEESEIHLFPEIDVMEENQTDLTVAEERWLRLMIGPNGVRYYMEERQG